MKNKAVINKLLTGFVLMVLICAGISSQEDWRETELITFEQKFTDIKAQLAILNLYTPEKSPGFKSLGKLSQILERINFSQRKFSLLIDLYNLIEDKIFPHLMQFYPKNPQHRQKILALIKRYSGKGERSIYTVQRNINIVGLSKKRLEKEIEDLQRNIRSSRLKEEQLKGMAQSDQNLSISLKIDKLEHAYQNFSVKLNNEEKRMLELKKAESKKKLKIKEKEKEILGLKKEAGN